MPSANHSTADRGFEYRYIGPFQGTQVVVDRYIANTDISADFAIFQISASADKFFCLADVFEAGLLF